MVDIVYCIDICESMLEGSVQYSEELFDKICGELAKGLSLVKICSQKGMPNPDSVYTWIRTKPGLPERYARAKEDSADVLAEQILDIADDGTNDTYTRVDEDGVPMVDVINHDHINRSRLRVDARKWVAAKLKPKKYGDKLNAEVGGVGGGPVVLQIVTGVPLPDAPHE